MDSHLTPARSRWQRNLTASVGKRQYISTKVLSRRLKKLAEKNVLKLFKMPVTIETNCSVKVNSVAGDGCFVVLRSSDILRQIFLGPYTSS